MKTELARSLVALHSASSPPYFLGYDITEVHQFRAASSFGAIMSESDERRRLLDVQVRVGSYDFDNTHATHTQFPDFGRFLEPVDIPVDDDPMTIRGALWYQTEQRYRAAVEQLSRARTSARLRVAPEDSSPDFSHEPPAHHIDAPLILTVDRAAWEAKLRRYTAPFSGQPDIYQVRAVFTAAVETHWYVNSEGTEIQTSEPLYRLIIEAYSKAADGMELPRYESFFASTAEGLPSDQEVLRAVDRMIVDLAALRRAPVIDPYTGPAILSGRASAVFFHEILGHRLEGHRQRNEDEGQTFTRHVPEAVLPSGFSVYFDPTLEKVGGTELAGHYAYDDEGVAARRVTVIDRGVLKTFLMSRKPIEGFSNSNGHGRRQPGLPPVARQSNLIVQVATPETHAQLKQQLLDEIRRQHKPFGLFFDDIEGGFTITERGTPNAFEVLPVMVYQVFPDGREQLVRGVDLIGTPLTVFSKVMAGDDQVAVFNGMCGAESGFIPVSAVSPGILVSQIEVQKKPKSSQRPPLLPPPDTGSAAVSPSDSGTVLMRAMRDELRRSMAELRLDTMPRPYFLSYRIDELTHLDADASRGSLTHSSAGRDRRLTVELRVGDYTFDNTNFLAMPSDTRDFTMEEDGEPDVPLDDDYGALRRELWLATDRSYKSAVADLSRKRASLANRAGGTAVPDFSREDPVTIADDQPTPRLDRERVEALVRSSSSVFQRAPDVYRSNVSWSGGAVRTWYVNSEGTSFTRSLPYAAIHVSASTRAKDGSPLSDAIAMYAPTPDALPARDSLGRRIDDFVNHLLQLRAAPVAETYSGPVLVEGDAAAELFASTLGSRFGADRMPLFDSPMMEGMMAMSGGDAAAGLLDRIGTRILPRSFGVIENPAQRSYEGRPIGGTLVDDEGVRTRETRLVDHGMLRTLLTTREPVPGILRSTGSRRSFGAAPTNVFVSTDSGLSDSDLRKRAVALAREQGLAYVMVVRRAGPDGGQDLDELLAMMRGPGGIESTVLSDAVRLYPDGHEEPVRNALLTGLTAAVFKDIAGASRARAVVGLPSFGHFRGGFAMVAMFDDGAPGLSGGVGPTTTYIVPSLLFEDAAVRARPAHGNAPPASQPPWSVPE
ncbi:MAG TPA: metallopeptidase TldD-related protein [Gemmatimonadales bacterium]|nr:metallopeptidase TldD-related protein [Gemmatimonadales bacterium]